MPYEEDKIIKTIDVTGKIRRLTSLNVEGKIKRVSKLSVEVEDVN